MENDQPLRCAFCERTQDEVKRLVMAQMPGVYICDGCVKLCAELLTEEGHSTESVAAKAEAKLIDDIGTLKENVKQSMNGVMENRLTASHLISDVHTLLEYLGKLEAILLESRSDGTTE